MIENNWSKLKPTNIVENTHSAFNKVSTIVNRKFTKRKFHKIVQKINTLQEFSILTIRRESFPGHSTWKPCVFSHNDCAYLLLPLVAGVTITEDIVFLPWSWGFSQICLKLSSFSSLFHLSYWDLVSRSFLPGPIMHKHQIWDLSWGLI